MVGLDSNFSWRNVVSGAISGAFTSGLGVQPDSNGVDLNNTLDGFGEGFAQGFTDSAIGSVVTRALTKDKSKRQDFQDIVVEAFASGVAQGLEAEFDISGAQKRFAQSQRDKQAANVIRPLEVQKETQVANRDRNTAIVRQAVDNSQAESGSQDLVGQEQEQALVDQSSQQAAESSTTNFDFSFSEETIIAMDPRLRDAHLLNFSANQAMQQLAWQSDVEYLVKAAHQKKVAEAISMYNQQIPLVGEHSEIMTGLLQQRQLEIEANKPSVFELEYWSDLFSSGDDSLAQSAILPLQAHSSDANILEHLWIGGTNLLRTGVNTVGWGLIGIGEGFSAIGLDQLPPTMGGGIGSLDDAVYSMSSLLRASLNSRSVPNSLSSPILRSINQNSNIGASFDTVDGLVEGLRGTTPRAGKIADAISEGKINASILDDVDFEILNIQKGGRYGDGTVALNEGNQIWLRQGSNTILSDTVHEGSHALDYIHVLTRDDNLATRLLNGNNHVWERRSYFYERQFQLWTNQRLEPHLESVSNMLEHVRLYPE